MIPLPPAPPPLIAAPIFEHISEIMALVTSISAAQVGMLVLALPLLVVMFEVVWIFALRRSRPS